ncbi:hypothetical protein ABES03_08715 [Neobacillus rhizosphaerae]|uniref:hypothetical protein n=1 Tax=Neobacillus rhizosphaerae TaxID=2880965 RepID=UPI003D29F609
MIRIFMLLFAFAVLEYFAFTTKEFYQSILFGVLGMVMFAMSIFELIVRGDY